MLTDIKSNWFEIPVSNVDRAQAFYEKVIDPKLVEIDGPDGKVKVFLSTNGPEGTLFRGERERGADGVRIYLNCPDIDAALGRCASAGGKVAQGKTPIGPSGYIAVLLDPLQNRIGLHCVG